MGACFVRVNVRKYICMVTDVSMRVFVCCVVVVCVNYFGMLLYFCDFTSVSVGDYVYVYICMLIHVYKCMNVYVCYINSSSANHISWYLL